MPLKTAEDLRQTETTTLEIEQHTTGPAPVAALFGRGRLGDPVDGGDGGNGAERGESRQHHGEGVGRDARIRLGAQDASLCVIGHRASLAGGGRFVMTRRNMRRLMCAYGPLVALARQACRARLAGTWCRLSTPWSSAR